MNARFLAVTASIFVACGNNGDTTIRQFGDTTDVKGSPLADSPGDDLSPVATGGITFLSGDDSTEKVFGENDLMPVVNAGANIPQQYRNFIDAYGILSQGCTAVHVGNGIIVSAGQCFGAGEYERRNVSCNQTIRWGVRRDQQAYMTSRCTRILAMRQNRDADYAIFQVDQAPYASVPVDTYFRPNVGTVITIFSHPQQRPLEWSKTCSLEPSSYGGFGAGQFSHQCDTEPGSAGGVMLTAQNPVAFGIHAGGVQDGNGYGWNYATYFADTPLGEFLWGNNPNPNPDTPQNQFFNGFGNHEDRTLTTLGNYGQTVAFRIESNTEEGYDFVHVRDANGNQWQQSGNKNRSYGVAQRLAAPVVIRFTSDQSVQSQYVNVLDITIR